MSSFDPFLHFAELPQTNFYLGSFIGLPRPDTMALPDGHLVATEALGHPETESFWLQGDGSQYHQITATQALAALLWLNFAYGVPVAHPITDPGGPLVDPLGELATRLYVTPFEFMDAVHTIDTAWSHDILAAYTDAEILSFVRTTAPGVLEE